MTNYKDYEWEQISAFIKLTDKMAQSQKQKHSHHKRVQTLASRKVRRKAKTFFSSL